MHVQRTEYLSCKFDLQTLKQQVLLKMFWIWIKDFIKNYSSATDFDFQKLFQTLKHWKTGGCLMLAMKKHCKTQCFYYFGFLKLCLIPAPKACKSSVFRWEVWTVENMTETPIEVDQPHWHTSAAKWILFQKSQTFTVKSLLVCVFVCVCVQ